MLIHPITCNGKGISISTGCCTYVLKLRLGEKFRRNRKEGFSSIHMEGESPSPYACGDAHVDVSLARLGSKGRENKRAGVWKEAHIHIP